jgi:hypothetical protein
MPKPLGTISRLPKQNTDGLIPDDGFVSKKYILMFSWPIERIKDYNIVTHAKSCCSQGKTKTSHENDQLIQHC